MVEVATLTGWDIAVIVLYFVIVLGVGLFATIRANRGSTEGFFLAGKSMTFIPIAGSIFATNVGAPMFVGLAGSAAALGIAPVMFEWHATYILILLGWVFVPIYIASATTTMPEYLGKRFGGVRLRVYNSIVQLVMMALTGISGEIYAGGLFIRQILGWNMYLSVLLILAVTSIYTIGGGLTAVIYTDTLQSGILIVGAAILAGLSITKVGGWEGMFQQFPGAAANYSYVNRALYGNTTCGFPPDDYMHIFRGVDSGYPWPGLTFGLTILATHYFCTNQVIVQRCLSAKNITHAKASTVVASYLKILPFFLFVTPGMVSRILYPQEIGCADPDHCNEVCGNPAGCTNIAYPLLVLRVMPTGLRGLMLAAMLAALMSSLTSIFNSSSTLFTMDIWQRVRPRASQNELVLTGRIFSAIMIGLSVAWLPILQLIQGSQLWNYLQSISSYINPPWVAVFLLGMFWPRCNEQGAFWGLMAGLIAGVIRMGIHFSFPEPSCAAGVEDTRPAIFKDVHYLHFAMILFAISFIVIVSVSLLTEPRPKRKLHRLTWSTRMDKEEPELSSDEEAEEEEELTKKDPEAPEDLSKARKVYNFICGIEPEQTKTKLSKEAAAAIRAEMTDIAETPFLSNIMNINAIIAIAVTCFLIGFFA
ncbi:unnamed protein product [Owenia fusiformis]|uniref:Uncharacterized protein n=1 Tax=Owenia fusiformis TaxID=6347 RepID=A0A8J1THK1_OWEFU|nr:unnamed protein product [Owenia fusiformis]